MAEDDVCGILLDTAEGDEAVALGLGWASGGSGAGNGKGLSVAVD